MLRKVNRMDGFPYMYTLDPTLCTYCEAGAACTRTLVVEWFMISLWIAARLSSLNMRLHLKHLETTSVMCKKQARLLIKVLDILFTFLGYMAPHVEKMKLFLNFVQCSAIFRWRLAAGGAGPDDCV